MTEFLSVFALAARSAFWKVAVFTACICGAETILCFLALSALPQGCRIEDFFDGSFLFILAEAAVLFVLFLLIHTSLRGSGKSRPDYTMARLCSSRKNQLLACALNAAVCCLFFLAVQLALFFRFCQMFAEKTGGADTDHAAVLTFLRTPAYNLLPFGNPLQAAGVLLLLLCFSITAAAFSLLPKGTKKCTYPLYVTALGSMQYISEQDSSFSGIALLLALLFSIPAAVYITYMFGKEETFYEYEEEQALPDGEVLSSGV